MEREQVQKGRDLTPFCWVFRFGKFKVWSHKPQAYETWMWGLLVWSWEQMRSLGQSESSADEFSRCNWDRTMACTTETTGESFLLPALSEPGSLAATVSSSIPVAPSTLFDSFHTLLSCHRILFLFDTRSYYSPGWFWTHDSTSAPKCWELQACATMVLRVYKQTKCYPALPLQCLPQQ